MIWKKCLLKAHEKVGEDALKNPIYEWKIVMKTKARFTPWTDEQIALDDRDVTKNGLTVYHPASAASRP